MFLFKIFMMRVSYPLNLFAFVLKKTFSWKKLLYRHTARYICTSTYDDGDTANTEMIVEQPAQNLWYVNVAGLGWVPECSWAGAHGMAG